MARSRLIVSILIVYTAVASARGGNITNTDCLACHGDSSLTGTVNGKQVSLYINSAQFSKSAHQVLSCTDCHTDIHVIPHASTLKMPACGSCHADEQAAYRQSVHGKAVAAGNTQAAGCVDCHGSPHTLLPTSDPDSRVAHGNIPKTCGACHQAKFVMQAAGVNSKVYVAYQNSVHGRAVAAGSAKAAVCSDCHGSHAILMAGDPKSSIFKFNVPVTCGKCHQTQRQEYQQSVHGVAVQQGDWSAPVCTDCHGIHSIQTIKGSAVSVQAVAERTCTHCHEGVRLTREYGVPENRVSSYLSTYHGMASQLGSTVVANCASCHGAHLILASSDPRSTVNKANLAVTCGKCHPGATAKFTRFPIHGATDGAGIGNTVIRWVKDSYIALIIVVLGAMVLHNAIIWRSKILARRELEDRLVLRMSAAQRIQHLLVLISFTVLVVTGFALLSPFSGIADAVGLIDPVRRIVHRIAGITLIVTGIGHLVYIAFNRGGRQLAREFLPDSSDLRDLKANLRYHLDLSHEKPEFGRFNYAEKLEYWALIWGTFVMATTGLIAWFQLTVTRYFPGWVIDVALIIHLYEAILATLAIVIWHFYQVMFDPDIYPMNWAWFDGRMSLSHYKHEHGRDVETIESCSVKRKENGGHESVEHNPGAAGNSQKDGADAKGPQ